VSVHGETSVAMKCKMRVHVNARQWGMCDGAGPGGTLGVEAASQGAAPSKGLTSSSEKAGGMSFID